MKRKLTYCLYAAFLSFFIVAVSPGCWWVLSPMPSGSFSTHSSTGSFGPREFESPEAVTEFNSKAKDWFIARGFTEVEGESFSDIVDSKSWDNPGVLIRLKHDENNRFDFFIPDCYRPEENVQNIGYHVELRGTIEETNRYDDEFEKLKNDFRNDFP